MSAIGFLAYYLIDTNTQDDARLNADLDEIFQNATFLENHPEKDIRALVLDGSGDFDISDDEELNFNQFENMPGKLWQDLTFFVKFGHLNLQLIIAVFWQTINDHK